MFKKLPIVFSILLASTGLSALALRADTLHLKNGQVVDGEFLSGDARSIQFRVRGNARTFQRSEVDQIQFSDNDEGNVNGDNPNMVPFENGFLEIMRPPDWQVADYGDSVSIFPRDRRVRRRNGPLVLAYGANIVIDRSIDVPWAGQYQSMRGYNRGSLEQATNQLIEELRPFKPNLRMAGPRQMIQVDGERAISLRFTSDSPLGGRETNWLITVPNPQGLIYIVFNAPDWDFQKHESYNFRPMLDSLRLAR